MALPQEYVELSAAVARDTTVKGSASTLLQGIEARILAAVDAATAAGVQTAAEMAAAVKAEVALLNTASDKLEVDVEANTSR